MRVTIFHRYNIAWKIVRNYTMVCENVKKLLYYSDAHRWKRISPPLPHRHRKEVVKKLTAASAPCVYKYHYNNIILIRVIRVNRERIRLFFTAERIVHDIIINILYIL